MSPLERDDVQGLVVRGYGRLQGARYLLGTITDPAAARRWLADVAVSTGADRQADEAVNVAFTAPGLVALGVRDDVLSQFSHEFREGMTEDHRRRFLGDEGTNAPDGWAWGGPGGDPIHLLVLVYAGDEDAVDAAATRWSAELGERGVHVFKTLTTAPLSDREPFGFRDGLSQPHLAGEQEGAARDAIQLGEVVLGYPNEYGRLTPRPLVEGAADALPADPGGSGRGDLGRNGTYLVLRSLEQDVEGFHAYCARATGDDRAQRKLEAKLVGRWPDGTSLALAPDGERPELASQNDFGYFETDRHGLGCPIGAHVRRANPRDTLDPAPGTDRSIAVNKRHRLLRRGRNYGAPGGAQGIHFIALGANLSRQFEFIQHSWLNDPSFNGMQAQGDPLLGSDPNARVFVMQKSPVRERHVDLPQFVRVRGGAYFFVPGVRALRFLAGARD
jgi:Dyp-type peroxidase family